MEPEYVQNTLNQKQKVSQNLSLRTNSYCISKK